MRELRVAPLLVAVMFAIAAPARARAGEGTCNENLDSTFALIENLIFEGHGCTSAACHSGPVPAGGLDLSPGVAYDQLLDRPPQSIPAEQFPGLARVIPSSKARSLLWLNLAAATTPDEWRAPLRPMPQGGLPPLSLDELELVRLWIEYGATREGVVPGTEKHFGTCVPPLKPLKVEPLLPPPSGVGVQIRAPQQTLPAQRERETCFVSYYDFTGQVPEESLGPDKTTFRYKRVDARQDPLSHHAVVLVYNGSADIHSSVWGSFTCHDGPRDGQSCDPTDLGACGEGGVCGSAPVQAVACIGFGPGDAGIGVADKSLFNTMATSVGSDAGVYNEAPLRGTLVWNSHAFNLSNEPAKLDIWINFEFAAPDEQLHRLQQFVDISAIGVMSVPAYGVEEVCSHHELPPEVRVLDLASHVHHRGRRFRMFEGAFRCSGGPNDGGACSPFGPDPDFPTPDICEGAPCEAPMLPRVGDCNSDLTVSIDELLTGVNIALGAMPMERCMRMDGDESGSVGIDELVAAVDAAIAPRMRTAEESLIYASYTYSDPIILTFDPAKRFGPPFALPEERTLTYCALYDNGYTNPEVVKRNSRVPANGFRCLPTHCAEGTVGEPCSNNAQCDTAPGAGDGFCDACTVGFGVTTDDEMFVITGSFIEG